MWMVGEELSENDVVVVQSSSCVWLYATPCTAAHQASLSLTDSQSLPRFMFMHLWCHPAISSSDALDLSQHQGLFQWVYQLSNPHPKSFALGLFQHQGLFQWVCQLSKSSSWKHCPKLVPAPCPPVFIPLLLVPGPWAKAHTSASF